MNLVKLSALFLFLSISFNTYGGSVIMYDLEGISNTTQSTTWVDKGTIRERDGYIYYSFIEEMVRPFNDGAWTLIHHMVADCKSKFFLLYKLTTYPSPLRHGPLDEEQGTVHEYNDTEWSYFDPNTREYKIVCDPANYTVLKRSS